MASWYKRRLSDCDFLFCCRSICRADRARMEYRRCGADLAIWGKVDAKCRWLSNMSSCRISICPARCLDHLPIGRFRSGSSARVCSRARVSVQSPVLVWTELVCFLRCSAWVRQIQALMPGYLRDWGFLSEQSTAVDYAAWYEGLRRLSPERKHHLSNLPDQKRRYDRTVAML